MAESRLLNDEVVSIFAPDADGCLYSVKRYRLLWLYFCDKYNNDITDDIWLAIKDEIHSINFNELDFEAILKNLRRYANLDSEALYQNNHETQKQVCFTFNELLSAYQDKIRKFEKESNDEEKDESISSAIFLKANDNFINYILEIAKQDGCTRAQTVIGSARQYYASDSFNIKRNATGSFFEDLKVLTECLQLNSKIKWKLDMSTNADVYAKLKRGSGYSKVLEQHEQDEEFKHPESIEDETKASIIYRIAHEAAIDHPNKKIVIHFFDDRADILNLLLQIFYYQNPERNPLMLPANVELCLHPYAGKQIALPRKIKGTGPVDYSYRQNMFKMLEMCIPNMGGTKKYDAAIQLDVEKFLTERKTEKQTLLSANGVFAKNDVQASKENNNVSVCKVLL